MRISAKTWRRGRGRKPGEGSRAERVGYLLNVLETTDLCNFFFSFRYCIYISSPKLYYHPYQTKTKPFGSSFSF